MTILSISKQPVTFCNRAYNSHHFDRITLLKFSYRLANDESTPAEKLIYKQIGFLIKNSLKFKLIN